MSESDFNDGYGYGAGIFTASLIGAIAVIAISVFMPDIVNEQTTRSYDIVCVDIQNQEICNFEDIFGVSYV